MIDFGYLYKGLCGLASAHRARPMAGHLGAAVIAGYFFGEDQPDLDDAVHRGVEKELERIIRGEESVWFDPKKSGITVADMFRPLPEETPQESLIATLAEALSRNLDQLRESGHNVIFASIALRALHDHPVYATPTIVHGIRKLIEGFNDAHPGRGYYGKERGWIVGNKVSLSEDDDFPPYQSEHDMARVVIDELIATASLRRQGFGGLWHVINHAAALVELSRFGYQELARTGLRAHRQHVRLWRSLPNVEAELGRMTRAEHDPRKPEFWATGALKRDEARLTHRIKTLYGFNVLLQLSDDQKQRKRASEAMLYLMA
jgi:hypothetical protein